MTQLGRIPSGKNYKLMVAIVKPDDQSFIVSEAEELMEFVSGNQFSIELPVEGELVD